MKEIELWQYFNEKKVAYSRPFDRDFIWITKTDFEIVQDFFVAEFNILNKGASFRSRAFFLHIHALVQGEYIFIHKDIGNVARFLPLGVIHLFIDVIPYFVLAKIKRVTFHSIYQKPD